MNRLPAHLSRGPDAERNHAPRPMPPMARTPVALSILNLLNERPMHPYEMAAMMRGRGHDRAFKIKESSVYDTVQRLSQRGLIEATEVRREGRWPERTVYAIRESGRDELLIWLTSHTSPEYPPLAAPLMYIYTLGPEGTVAALEARAVRLEAEIAGSDAFRATGRSQHPDFPRLFGIEEEFAQEMRRAELAWVRRIATELRNGILPWPVVPDAEEAGESC
jgi:DNA-binding PadR family transcriptional regulator